MWNDDWRTELSLHNSECFWRLCDCRNTHNDIKIITKLMSEYNQHKTLEECLDRVLEWICSWNDQPELYPQNPTEYDILLNSLAR